MELSKWLGCPLPGFPVWNSFGALLDLQLGCRCRKLSEEEHGNRAMSVTKVCPLLYCYLLHAASIYLNPWWFLGFLFHFGHSFGSWCSPRGVSARSKLRGRNLAFSFFCGNFPCLLYRNLPQVKLLDIPGNPIAPQKQLLKYKNVWWHLRSQGPHIENVKHKSSFSCMGTRMGRKPKKQAGNERPFNLYYPCDRSGCVYGCGVWT